MTRSGDLLFNGIAQTAYRRSMATGVQGDGSWRISPDHTLRSGFYIQGERSPFSTTSDVLPVDDMGMQTTDMPLTIFDSGGKTGWLYSYYLQDEWKIVPTLTLNFGARFDLVDEFAQRASAEPARQCRVAADRNDDLHAGYSRYFVPPPFELVAAPTIALFANTTAAPAITQDTTVKGGARPLLRCRSHVRSFCPGSRPGSTPITSSPATSWTKGSSARRSS